ncbi:MAG: alpha/beta fold hydrolase [Gaiellaceae bacterium]
MLVAVPGGDLHVEERGSGDPLLLIQGLGYAVWAWRFSLDVFAERWRVVALDNRGAGRSFKPSGEYSIEQLADDAAAVLAALGIDRAHVLGHSMGGYVAQTLALRRPDRVDSLVLCGTGAGSPTHEPIPPSTVRAWAAVAGLPPEEFARQTMHLSFSRGWAAANGTLYEDLLAARLEFPTPPECWRAQFDACVRFVEAGAPVERIEARTLVLHGDLDEVVPVSNGRALARRIPDAELVEFPGAGHNLPLEEPERFNAVVADFLGRAEAA